MASILDAENDDGFMELRPVQTRSEGEMEAPQAEKSWSDRLKAESPSTKRETPEPELDDGASNKAILPRLTWS